MTRLEAESPWILTECAAPDTAIPIDGVCRIDENAPAVPDPGEDTALVANTVGGGGQIYPDAGFMEYILLHLAKPEAFAGAGADMFVSLQMQRIDWTLAADGWGVLSYDFFLDWITQDFDWNNDGSVAPPRNTWATQPTVIAGTQFTLGVDVTDCVAAEFSPPDATPVLTFHIEVPAAMTVYGIRIRPVSWTEATGTVFASTQAWFTANGVGTYLLPLL